MQGALIYLTDSRIVPRMDSRENQNCDARQLTGEERLKMERASLKIHEEFESILHKTPRLLKQPRGRAMLWERH